MELSLTDAALGTNVRFSTAGQYMQKSNWVLLGIYPRRQRDTLDKAAFHDFLPFLNSCPNSPRAAEST